MPASAGATVPDCAARTALSPGGDRSCRSPSVDPSAGRHSAGSVAQPPQLSMRFAAPPLHARVVSCDGHWTGVRRVLRSMALTGRPADCRRRSKSLRPCKACRGPWSRSHRQRLCSARCSLSHCQGRQAPPLATSSPVRAPVRVGPLCGSTTLPRRGMLCLTVSSVLSDTSKVVPCLLQRECGSLGG
jgi:hypothetical protein